MGIEKDNTSEVFVDEEPYSIRTDQILPFQARESAKAVQARLDRMAELGHLIPRVAVTGLTEDPRS